ncbi:MAG: hypothetical protein RL154_644 [Pseudomonadota bacterium]
MSLQPHKATKNKFFEINTELVFIINLIIGNLKFINYKLIVSRKMAQYV